MDEIARAANRRPGAPWPPRQPRSQETLDRIVEAAYAITSREGFEAATLMQIASAAGVAVGTVYSRFRDKEALLSTLHERATTRSRRFIEERFLMERSPDQTLKTILEEMIRSSVELARSMAGFQRAAFQRALTDPAFAEREAEVRNVLAQATRKVFLARRNEIGHPDPDRAVQFFVTLYVSVITEHVMTERFPSDTLSEEDLARELIDACSAYLRLREEPA
jgi:AcrR family transcriptional regulator